MGRCKFVVGTPGDIQVGRVQQFPVSKLGWRRALSKASNLAVDDGYPVDINLRCGPGVDDEIFMLTCTGKTCDTSISGRATTGGPPPSEKVIAGLGRRRGSKKRKKARDKKKRTGPLTPQQKKFKEIAAACKGTADYRGCVTEKLRK